MVILERGADSKLPMYCVNSKDLGREREDAPKVKGLRVGVTREKEEGSERTK